MVLNEPEKHFPKKQIFNAAVRRPGIHSSRNVAPKFMGFMLVIHGHVH